MLYRVYISKDTFITNRLINGTRVTASNAGASETLQVFKRSSTVESGSRANIIVGFNTSSALAAYSASASGSQISWRLHMSNVETQNPNAGSFTLTVLPMQTSNWDEGKGHDIDYYTDKGFANFNDAKRGVPWDVGTFAPAITGVLPSVTQSFDTGHEDLDVDITPLTGWCASQALWIGISTLDDNDYYLKAFRSRHTHFPEYRPYLEARWNDFTGSYNSSFIDVVDATGALVGGVYNLKTVYDRSENPILRTYFRPRDWNMSVVTTASSDVSGTVLTNAYYRIVDDVSDEIVVPFGTGSPAYTRLSYDDAGNYFQFYMQNLTPGFVYRFDVGYYDRAGEWHVELGKGNTFRVI